MDLENKVKDFLQDMRLGEMSKGTLRTYSNCLSKFIEYAGDKEVTKALMLDYKDFLSAQGYKKTYINKHISALNKFFIWSESPDLTMKRLKLQQKQYIDNIPTDADYQRMLRFAKRLEQMDTYMIIKTIANTGVRVEELKFFTVENLSRAIEVTNKGKTRIVPIRQELLRELKKYAREHRIKSGSLFPGENPPKMMDVSTIWRRIQKVGLAAKIRRDKLHPHALRHYFGKKYLEIAGNTILDLADILGHDNVETTRIYNRGTMSETRKKIERMKY